MRAEYLNYILAFIEGFALIISPCILPVLPIILSGSIQGGKRRPIGVILGFLVVFIFFTLFSRKLLEFFGVDLNIIRDISLVVLFLFGVILLSKYLTAKFEIVTTNLANVGSSWKIINTNNIGFWSGFVFGGLIGIIWTPCAGPILAAVIVQSILQQTDFASFVTILFFAIGVGIPMLAIVFFGRELTSRLKFFKVHALFLQRLLGFVIIGSVLYMVYWSSITISFIKPKENYSMTENMLVSNINNPYPMPKIAGISSWINSDPIQNEQLKGKVVLIDFWTYSCINCIRSLPYLKDWYEKYHDNGLVIIGIHSPEFEFEKDFTNVEKAVKNLGIKYAVGLDNNYTTWQNFNNHYWPAHYLIDKNGNVIYQHFGEGEYDVMENNIRFLLGMSSMPMHEPKESYYPQTPETYFGYERIYLFNSPEAILRNQSNDYSYPKKLSDDAWALQGKWIIEGQKIVAVEPNAAIKIHFRAGKVYAVMGSASKLPIKVKLFLDDKPAPINTIEVKDQTLYTLIDSKKPLNGILELITESPGLEIYTFTFGN
jgi:cytochrome c biogenesis protein CcdA/thiol-disulfide isomerase/thioredoxin